MKLRITTLQLAAVRVVAKPRCDQQQQPTTTPNHPQNTTTTTLESATPDHTRDDTRKAEHGDTGTRSTRAVTAQECPPNAARAPVPADRSRTPRPPARRRLARLRARGARRPRLEAPRVAVRPLPLRRPPRLHRPRPPLGPDELHPSEAVSSKCPHRREGGARLTWMGIPLPTAAN